MNFMDTGKGYSIIDKSVPESAVAYQEEYILGLCKKNRIEAIKPVIRGEWSGIPKRQNEGWQDIIIGKKAS